MSYLRRANHFEGRRFRSVADVPMRKYAGVFDDHPDLEVIKRAYREGDGQLGVIRSKNVR